MTLKDIPYEIAENAVMEHICTNIYPPNIAEIRKLCMERCKTPILSFDEAWGVVQKQCPIMGGIIRRRHLQPWMSSHWL